LISTIGRPLPETRAWKADVALVSSLGIFARPIIRIVDGASISAHGAVYSVIVAHNEDLSRAEEIEIDLPQKRPLPSYAASLDSAG